MSAQSGPAQAARTPFGNTLAAYVLRRLAFAVLTVWVVCSLVYVALRALPSNPVDVMISNLMLNSGMSEDEARSRTASMFSIDLGKPLSEQYFSYLGNVLRGNLGASVKNQSLKVSSLIASRLPWTIFSIGLSLVISFSLGLLLGTLAAYFRNTVIDRLITTISVVLDAVPAVIIAVALFFYLGVVWRAVPLDQMKGSLSPRIVPGFTVEFFADALKHYAVLGLAYVLTTIGSWVMAMKSSTVSTLGEDYVTVAKARGLGDWRIVTSYIGRNASLPLVTRLATAFGLAIGGSLVFENVFTYTGIGTLLFGAIVDRDYPVIQGIVLVISIAVVVSGLITDVLYGWLDPRVRVSGSAN